METKGIIISKEDYDRLIGLEKNFDEKVKEYRECFRQGLDNLIKQNLVKILWVNDEYYAKIMGCDLSEDGVSKFISKEDADFLASVNSKVSYDRNEFLKDNGKRIKEVTSNQKKVIRNLWWAFGIMFAAWLVQLILYIAK